METTFKLVVKIVRMSKFFAALRIMLERPT